MPVELVRCGRQDPSAPALLDAATGEVWSYGRLDAELDRIVGQLPDPPGVALVPVGRDVPSLLAYLAALRSGHAVLPVEASLDPTLLGTLLRTYRPELALGPASAVAGVTAVDADAFRSARTLASDAPLALAVRAEGGARDDPPHPALGLLLSTSGSTGGPKLVRLSQRNVLANADQIRRALSIDAGERAITSLAFSYSFGLSVVHSHLLAGASLVVSGRSIVMRDFWRDAAEHAATSFSGVPYTYELLRKLRFERIPLPALRTLTQAGGKLGVEMVERFRMEMERRGGQLVVMYGQTEATARIAVMPPERLAATPGGVGYALPEGTLRVRLESGEDAAPGEEGEVVYAGPNVMMGYAESRADLARGDELGGVLATGDAGYLGADGCLHITGRIRRIAKVMGLRVSLDDVEGHLQGAGPVAALDGGDRVVVCTLLASEAQVRTAVHELAGRMRVHPRSFDLTVVDSFPLLPNGKIDYRALAQP